MSHHCHWPGCKVETRNINQWACDDHWVILPRHIKDALWETYVTKGYSNKDMRVEYIEVFRLAHDWALRYELRKKEQETVLKGIEELGEEIGL
jgi:hypothetical protein